MFTSKGLLADDICLDGAAHFDLSPPGTTIMWRYQVRFSDMEKTIASAWQNNNIYSRTQAHTHTDTHTHAQAHTPRRQAEDPVVVKSKMLSLEDVR